MRNLARFLVIGCLAILPAAAQRGGGGHGGGFHGGGGGFHGAAVSMAVVIARPDSAACGWVPRGYGGFRGGYGGFRGYGGFYRATGTCSASASDSIHTRTGPITITAIPYYGYPLHYGYSYPYSSYDYGYSSAPAVVYQSDPAPPVRVYEAPRTARPETREYSPGPSAPQHRKADLSDCIQESGQPSCGRSVLGDRWHAPLHHFAARTEAGAAGLGRPCPDVPAESRAPRGFPPAGGGVAARARLAACVAFYPTSKSDSHYPLASTRVVCRAKVDDAWLAARAKIQLHTFASFPIPATQKS